MSNILEKYSHLLVNYCLAVKAGDKVYISSTPLAEPLPLLPPQPRTIVIRTAMSVETAENGLCLVMHEP